MLPASEIVHVVITRETVFPARHGFGTLLIVGESDRITGRTQEFANLAQMEAAGYLVTDPEYIAASSVFNQNPRPRTIKTGRKDVAPAETWVEALAAIDAADNDWYALAITSRTVSDVTAVAGWVEDRTKLFGTASDNADILDAGSTTDVAYLLNDAERDRTFTLFSGDEDQFPECGLFGRCLPLDPGSITWKFKTINGIEADNLTPAQRGAAADKECNTYETIANVDMVREGVVASGEFIDVIHGVDWLSSTMAGHVFGALAKADKVPYTDAGVAIIEAEIRRALDDAVEAGLIVAGYTVTVPNVADLDPADRAARRLTNVSWVARLAGAVHFVEIQGTVTV